MYNREIVVLPSLKNGYQQFYDPKHPLAYSNGCVYLHRHMASVYRLGRWVMPTEVVHHKDENKLNNAVENLEVLSFAEHANLHRGTAKLYDIFCETCGNSILSKRVSQRFCNSVCQSKFSIKDKTLTKEMLDELIPGNSWVVLGIMFGYSDNGIKKRAIALGCDITKAKYKKQK